MTTLQPQTGAFGYGDPRTLTLGFDGPPLDGAAWPDGVAGAPAAASPRRSLPPHEARHAALDLAREVLDGAGRSPHGHRAVSRALELLGDRYRGATQRDEPAARQALESLGNRLIDFARDAGMLKREHSDFATMAAHRPAMRREPTAPAPPPLPAQNGQAGTTPPRAPPLPPTAAPQPGASVQLTARSFVSPAGTGANTALTGRAFFGATLREGDGAPPANWVGVSPKPYREVFAGLTTSDLIFDAGNRLDALQPRFVTGYSTGDGRSQFGVQLWRELEPDAAGRQAEGVQASYSRLNARGKPGTRIDLQVASPASVPGASARLAGRAEQFVPIGDTNVLRLRASAAYSGVPGETVGVAGSVAIDPPPFPGTFPAGRRGSPMRPGLELAASRAPAPLPGQPGRATDTLAVNAALVSPDTVLTASVSHARTGDVEQVRLAGTAMTRLGANDIGDPPTTVTANGIDPAGMPTGRYPAGARGSNTTAYARFTVTLADDGPPPRPGSTFPGRDSVTVGVVHTRSHGPLANAYVQGTADATRYADGTAPAERVGVTAGVHLRPDDDVPVTIHVSGNAGAGGESVSAGITLMPDGNTPIEAGARFDVDRNEVQGYGKLRIRL